MQEQVRLLTTMYDGANRWTIAFEFELPRERGRRPDIVILAEADIFVLEFKDTALISQAHIDQVQAYTRDLSHYHAASHNRNVFSMLVLTERKEPPAKNGETWVLPGDFIASTLQDLHTTQSSNLIVPEEWLNADYAPLPTLISAARSIFNHEPLPRIKRAYSAGVPETIEHLIKIARKARDKREYHLALVTGVPGAGKTLVGLQFVYCNHFSDPGDPRNAVFLSGNGPLVKVLQHALRSSVFVQDVHGFLKQYGGRQGRMPDEHIWIYDEAQRAWDADRVGEKRGVAVSEPEDFLKLAERMDSWAMMVGLIGEGQEIHIGEEGGLRQWNDAIAATSKPWAVHCPFKVQSIFSAASSIEVSDTLNLTTSLRSHLAEEVQTWIQQLLDGKIEKAGQTSISLSAQGFNMYITRDLEKAKDYVRERYMGQSDKRYGLLASSKAKNLTQYGVHNEYNYTKNLREGPWYNDDPDSRLSSCQLNDVATEFACQGLELDFPIVCWGDDMWRERGNWRTPPTTRRSRARDPHQLRINSYRVLLSRGRDGFVVFLPSHHDTFDALRLAGLREL